MRSVKWEHPASQRTRILLISAEAHVYAKGTYMPLAVEEYEVRKPA